MKKDAKTTSEDVVKGKPHFEVIVGESLVLETTSRMAAMELANFQAGKGLAVLVRRSVDVFRRGGTTTEKEQR